MKVRVRMRMRVQHVRTVGLRAAMGEACSFCVLLLTYKVHDIHHSGSTAWIKLHTTGDSLGDHIDREGLCSF